MDLRRAGVGPRFQHRRPAHPAAHGQNCRSLRQTLSGTRTLNTTPLPIRLGRVLQLAGLLVLGALVIVLVFPLCPPARRRRLKARWSAALCHSLALEIEADLGEARPGSLIVANHISWIDIFVINALLPSAFVSKEEVRRWPVIGWLAAHNGTVFLRRGSRGHAKIINQEIGERLAAGEFVAVFPEGTTTDGTHVLHFHAALLQPALLAGCPVLPIALSYHEPDGRRSLAPRYDGDISLGACLGSILRQRRLVVRVVAGTALGLAGEDRRQVAHAARAAIMAAAGIDEVVANSATTGDYSSSGLASPIAQST